MAKKERHAKIIEIIANKEVETQEELCEHLNALGYAVTQATVSRDINELNLIKVNGREKKYKYATVFQTQEDVSNKMKRLFTECVISIKYSNNLIIVKTLSGNGSNAGMVVDKLKIPNILGSVAGDDTLLIVAERNEDAPEIVEKLNSFINK